MKQWILLLTCGIFMFYHILYLQEINTLQWWQLFAVDWWYLRDSLPGGTCLHPSFYSIMCLLPRVGTQWQQVQQSSPTATLPSPWPHSSFLKCFLSSKYCDKTKTTLPKFLWAIGSDSWASSSWVLPLRLHGDYCHSLWRLYLKQLEVEHPQTSWHKYMYSEITDTQHLQF